MGYDPDLPVKLRRNKRFLVDLAAENAVCGRLLSGHLGNHQSLRAVAQLFRQRMADEVSMFDWRELLLAFGAITIFAFVFWLVAYESSTQYRPRFDFYGIAERSVRTNVGKEMDKAIARALRSAK